MPVAVKNIGVYIIIAFAITHLAKGKPSDDTQNSLPSNEHFKVESPDFFSFSRGLGISVSEKYGKEAFQLLLELTPPEYWNHPEFGILPFNTQCDSCIELIHLRDEYYRYFVSISHPRSRYFVQKANGPLHYKDKNGWWRTINWYLVPENGAYVSHQPEMMVTIQPQSVTTFLKMESDNYSLSMTKNSLLIAKRNGTEEVLALSNRNASFHIGSSGLIFNNFFEEFGIDKVIKVSRLRVAFEYVFNKPFEEWQFSDDDTLIIIDTIYVTGLSLPLPNGTEVETFALIPEDSSNVTKLEFLEMWILNKERHAFYSPNYEVAINGSKLIIKVAIPFSELKKPDTEFPLVLDPIISVTASNAVDCGFGHDGNGGRSIYCPCQVTITGLGGTQLVNAYYYLQWQSNCGINCGLSTLIGTYYHLDAQAHGWVKVYSYACNIEDPSGALYWTCLDECTSYGCTGSCTVPCGVHSCGTCGGGPISNPSFVDCLAPQCPDYTLTFESRNYHVETCTYFDPILGLDQHYCFCTIPCDASTGTCLTYELFMSAGWFSVTVEGRTVEALATANTNPDTLTITCGQTVDLCSNPTYGVPGYTTNWYIDTGATPVLLGTVTTSTGCLTGYSPPAGLTRFFAVVTDACGNTFSDTVYVDNTCILSSDEIVLTTQEKGEDLFLKWIYEGSEKILTFYILHGKQSGKMKVYSSIPANSADATYTHNLGTLDSTKSGFWQIKGITANGTEVLSNVVHISEDLFTANAKVYVNDNKIIIELPGISHIPDISIYSIDGKLLEKLESQHIDKDKIEFSVDHPGKYIVKVGSKVYPISIMEF